MSYSMGKPLSIITVFIIGMFFIYHSLNFKLDASSDTLILQNDEDFRYFNYYNEIFPKKNFLILAIKSNNKIDQEFIKSINKIKVSLSKIEYVDSIFTISDAPILISSKLRLEDLNINKIPTLKDTQMKLFYILMYLKVYPTYDLASFIFSVDRSRCCRWTKYFLPILSKVLDRELVLPKRKINSMGEFIRLCPDVKDLFLDGNGSKITSRFLC